MTILLAVDTSNARTGLALYDGDQLLGELSCISILRQTAELAPAMLGLFSRTNSKIEAVKAIGVAIGPGSFTSLRVGLALAKGLSLARRIPLIGVPSLDILAASIPVQVLPLVTAIQAGRGRLIVGWYHASQDRWQADDPPSIQTIDELADAIKVPTLVCGEMTAGERQRLSRKYKNVHISSPAHSIRRPGILAELAWDLWQAGKTDPAASLAPIYLYVAGGPPA
jgi:tRNA threonylcarbamoyladenosine biosynthesis protein TsaB